MINQGETMIQIINKTMINLLDTILFSKEVVKNFHDVYENNRAFRDWIDETIPQIELCQKQKQKTPWHIYNVLDHILHSVEEMNKLSGNYDFSDRRILVYTMFLHDIGKPESHSYDEKRKRDRFFNHNIKSEEIARNVLPRLDFSFKERKIIEKLIFKHDIFMFIKPYPVSNPYWKELTDNLIKQEMQDLEEVGNGYKLMNFLIMVGKSDTLAQNPQMASTEVHDKMEKMLCRIQFDKDENASE